MQYKNIGDTTSIYIHTITLKTSRPDSRFLYGVGLGDTIIDPLEAIKQEIDARRESNQLSLPMSIWLPDAPDLARNDPTNFYLATRSSANRGESIVFWQSTDTLCPR